MHNLQLKHSGVGDAKVYADRELLISFSGVGDVRFKGNPEKKEIQKNGIGSVKST